MENHRDELLNFSKLRASKAQYRTAEPSNLSSQQAVVESLSKLTNAPRFYAAEGFETTEGLHAVYYEALPFRGQPTAVFGWLGFPEDCCGTVPAIVLVHGGGGTAYREWVSRWNERGYAAISIAVEGQTSVPNADDSPDSPWERHERSGPRRSGIYGDSCVPLTEQWMYHAVANTILANSLLRSIEKVDATRIGLMGISWGGVIASAAIGFDARFAFAVMAYGCGGLAEARNQYGRVLGNNALYRQVWDPMLRLSRVKLPTLWFSWPEDEHFPMDCLAANYAAVTKEYMVSLVPKLGHGHEASWQRPETYAFADSIVSGDGPWCLEKGACLHGCHYEVTFSSSKPLDGAVLVATQGHRVSGECQWRETPAKLVQRGGCWVAMADLPLRATAWFVNVTSGKLVATGGYRQTELDVSGDGGFDL